MNRIYETLLLAVPEITADEEKAVETQLEEAVKDLKGTVLSYERWGKYKLAYPVRKYDYGVYFLMRFELNNEKQDNNILDAINTVFSVKQSDLIMRHVVTRLDPKKGLEYQRAESLEEVPTHREDFLKQDKATDFLKESRSLDFEKEDDQEDIMD